MLSEPRTTKEMVLVKRYADPTRRTYFPFGGGGGLSETPFGLGMPDGIYVAQVFPASG